MSNQFFYRIYYVNFRYFSEKIYDILSEAIDGGKKNGFEFAIYRQDKCSDEQTIIGSWSPIGGWRSYNV